MLDMTAVFILFATADVGRYILYLYNIPRVFFPGEMDDLICALKNLDAFRDFTPGGNRKRGRAAVTQGQVLSYASSASSKSRTPSMSTNSTDRIFSIS